MEYIFSALASLSVAILGFILQSVIRENRELKRQKDNKCIAEEAAIKDGLQCLLRDRLINNHKKYVDLGHISTHGIQNWLLMYNAYHALGGNGMVDHMKEEVEDLPIK